MHTLHSPFLNFEVYIASVSLTFVLFKSIVRTYNLAILLINITESSNFCKLKNVSHVPIN